MIVQSLRLGEINVPDDKLIVMERPVLGFENFKKFCLVEVEDFKPLLWLQSVEEAAIAFLVVNPKVFVPEYVIEINSKEIAELDIQDINDVETYVIVTLAEKPEEMTVNLQGPILINTENNRGKQLVLVNSDYEVKYRFLDRVIEEVGLGESIQEEYPVGV